ncbi:MAG: hypothetical protein LQ350_005445 [Teloschistes chrysophthalmus]|nr:MAG: hypothetical protein LQ350_005445 [Niorma chrysophthalma]
MSRRVFDVGLDVDRIKNGLKLHSSAKRNKNHHRSASTDDARPKTPDNSNHLAAVPILEERKRSPVQEPQLLPENLPPFSPTDKPVSLPDTSSPTTDDFLKHSANMNGRPQSPDGHMEDDSQDFDLKPPPPKRPVKFLETHSEQLFSHAHLRTVLEDSTFFMRFTAFLNRYKPSSAPILIRYLEAQKAIKAVEYANALAESFKPIPGDTSSNIPCLAATLDTRFESRSRRALEHLVNEALPAYITQCFTKVVTESMVREITGTTMPIMRELVGGLAEVFCLSDPSIPDNPIIYASEEFYRTTQYGRDYVIGRNCRFLQGPKTDRNTINRIKEAVRTGQESFETILNYRRDGSPFMNLVMTAPLYDNKGVVKYYIGAQVDISGLVEEGRGLDSFERLLNESRRKRNSGNEYGDQNHIRTLSEFGQLLSFEENSALRGGDNGREGNVSREDNTEESERSHQQSSRRRDPHSRPPRRVLGHDDDSSEETDLQSRNAWAFNSLGPSGKLPGVYQNYLLLRPHPSLRIIFVSPALRIPGLLQSPFLSRIGGPPRVRNGLAKAFEQGEDITAKVTWLPQGRPTSTYEDRASFPSRPGSRTEVSRNEGTGYPAAPAERERESRTRYISCTPLLGSDDQVGVWMVVMVENETVTGSLPSRTNAIARYGQPATTTSTANAANQNRFSGEYGNHINNINTNSNTSNTEPKTSDERMRSPAPSWARSPTTNTTSPPNPFSPSHNSNPNPPFSPSHKPLSPHPHPHHTLPPPTSRYNTNTNTTSPNPPSPSPSPAPSPSIPFARNPTSGSKRFHMDLYRKRWSMGDEAAGGVGGGGIGVGEGRGMGEMGGGGMLGLVSPGVEREERSLMG